MHVSLKRSEVEAIRYALMEIKDRNEEVFRFTSYESALEKMEELLRKRKEGKALGGV